MSSREPVSPVGRAALAAAAFTIVTYGCHAGGARDTTPAAAAREPGWSLVTDVPLVRQDGMSDCGAAALTMALRHFGVGATLDDTAAALAALPPAPPDAQGAARGVRARDLRAVARARGVDAFIVEGELADLAGEVGGGRPAIVGLVKSRGGHPAGHYELVVGYNAAAQKILTLDPASGWKESPIPSFAEEWVPARRVTLVLRPR